MSTIKTLVNEKGLISYISQNDSNPLVEFKGSISASQYIGVTASIPSNIVANSIITQTISASQYIGDIATYFATGSFHEPTITAGRGTSSPGQGPDIIVINTTLALQFTPNVTTDRAYRIFKIPTKFVANPAFHIHWTKSNNLNESGKYVRWHLSYTVFNGSSQDILSGSVNNLYIEDTYDDSNLNTRITYRTPNIPAQNFIAGYYVSIFIDAESPVSGSALASEPVLVSLDLTYDAYINH